MTFPYKVTTKLMLPSNLGVALQKYIPWLAISIDQLHAKLCLKGTSQHSRLS